MKETLAMPRRLLIVAAALALTACGRESVEPARLEGFVRLSDQFTGDFELVDKNGDTRTDEDFEGKVMLVYFGFTHCPDVCPTDIGVMSAALNQLGNDADEIAPLFISVDPERDTPEALFEYFAFDDRIVPLTGTTEAAEAARAAFKIAAYKAPLPDSALEYTVQHQQAFFVTDRAGQPQIAIMGGAAPDELAGVLRRSIRDE